MRRKTGLGDFWRLVEVTYRLARRVVVAVIGATVVACGVVLLVAPGPALIVIPIGLGILALEFSWARSWLGKVREAADYVARKTAPREPKWRGRVSRGASWAVRGRPSVRVGRIRFEPFMSPRHLLL